MTYKTRISPTAMARTSRCLQAWYLQCCGDPLEKREPDAGMRLLFKQGMAYERQCVSFLPDVENLADQCRLIKNQFALPVFSDGIKQAAPVFGFAWSADDAGGLNSEAWYKE